MDNMSQSSHPVSIVYVTPVATSSPYILCQRRVIKTQMIKFKETEVAWESINDASHGYRSFERVPPACLLDPTCTT